MTGTMEITTMIGCKINCKFCPQKLLIENYKENRAMIMAMEMDLYKKCIDKIPSDIVIDFSGMCEPWLNPNCTDMVEYAVKKGHEVRIYTTLIGMKEADIERLSKIPIRQFTLHVPDEDENSHIDVDETYFNVLRKLMSTPISKVKSLSCHGKILQAVEQILSDDWGKDFGTLIDRAGNVLDDDVTHRHVRGEIVCSECGLGLNHNVLLPDGTVLLCCMDYGMKHVLGNLYKDSYESLFLGEEANKIKRNMCQGDGEILCRSCSNALNNQELAVRYINNKEEAFQLWKTQLWMQEQIQNLSKANKDLKNGCEELQQGKFWIEDQYNNIREENEKLRNWCDELQQGKTWIEGQYDNIKEEKARLQSWCDELQQGKDWIENEWHIKCRECDELKEQLRNKRKR